MTQTDSTNQRFHDITSSPMNFTIHAPGRVNLLGEHTDYNGLPVLPMAIQKTITLEGAERNDRHIRAWALDVSPDPVEFDLEPTIPKHPQGHWINYVKAGIQGILDSLSLEEQKNLHGCDIVISGTIPLGVGLSSSSALVTGSALAFLETNRLPIDRVPLAERMAAAEHYVGTRGGGMDQATCLLGQKGHALKIDFFPLRANPVPLPDSTTIVVCDSRVRAKKTENALRLYNLRAVECRFAAMLLRAFLQSKDIPSDFQRLGDLFNSPWNYTYEDLIRLIAEGIQDMYSYQEICDQLVDEDEIRCILTDYSFENEREFSSMRFACGKRFRHIVTDGMRVEQSAKILHEGNAAEFGRLMNQGQVSARDDFEISCPELDRLVELALKFGALGARLTGAGFGGCTVNLVERNKAGAFVQNMRQAYYPDSNPSDESIFTSKPGPGAVIKRHEV